MKHLLYITLAAGAIWLSGCTGTRMAGGEEFDDVYATSADYQAEIDANNAAAEEAEARRNASNVPSNMDEYDQGYASKYADDPDFVGDYDPYAEDDFHYSRRLRRFNTRGFNYYDPYFAYDPYYAIGTPAWGAYQNSPWWYDPFFYSGPSWAWTSSWGAPGYAFYPTINAWNRPWWDRPTWGWGNSWAWNNGWGGGWNGGWGAGWGGGFGGGFTTFGGWGGWGGSNFAGGWNPYCPPGGFGWNNGFNNGWGGGFAGTGGTTTTTYGPRNNPSSLNTNTTPGTRPQRSEYNNPRSVRPYQGNFPVNSSVTNATDASGNPLMGRPSRTPTRANTATTPRTGNVGRPSTNRPTTTRPGTTRPSSTYSTPRNSNTYTRPSTPRTTTPRNATPRNNSVTPRSTTPRNNSVTPRSTQPSRNYTRPSRSNNSGSGRSYSRPSRSNDSGSSRSYSSPSRSNSSGSSRSFSSPSRSSGSSGRSSGGRRR
jgi:hypothetical protein